MAYHSQGMRSGTPRPHSGAGMHFMVVEGRYRASLNFPEQPRVVIELKRPAGLVRDVSITTRRAHEIIALLQPARSAAPVPTRNG
jgi:hypothetical protein